MKKGFPVIFTALLLPLFMRAQDSSYTIWGNFSVVKDGLLYLRYFSPKGIIYDSSVIVKGKFFFKGYSKEPTEAMLFFKPGMKKKYPSDMLTIYLEHGQINLSGRGDTLSALTVKGSPLTEDRLTLKKMMQKMPAYGTNFSLLRQKAEKDSMLTDSINKMETAYYADKRAVVKEFILAHPGSLLSALLIPQYFADDEAGFKDAAILFNSLTPRIRDAVAADKAKKLVTAYYSTGIGNYLPEIAQPDTLGNIQSLSKLKGNYVLVDFWASWCNPCRAEFDNLRKAYAKYHSKGFDIYGISYDSEPSRTAWLAAINKSNLPGVQVSSLSGWYNSTSDAFWIKAIPANFLLDKEGRIIAKDLLEDALPAKLAELMPE